MEKKGTLKRKGDRKSHFGPLGDQSLLKGTNLGTVVLSLIQDTCLSTMLEMLFSERAIEGHCIAFPWLLRPNQDHLMSVLPKLEIEIKKGNSDKFVKTKIQQRPYWYTLVSPSIRGSLSSIRKLAAPLNVKNQLASKDD